MLKAIMAGRPYGAREDRTDSWVRHQKGEKGRTQLSQLSGFLFKNVSVFYAQILAGGGRSGMKNSSSKAH